MKTRADRRSFIKQGVALALGASAVDLLASPLHSRKLHFPRDAGAHPDYQTEWWYLTGWANVPGREAAFGFQVTFFRSRVPQAQSMQSALAAKQLVFAHAALTDVAGKKLWHDQRIARWSGSAPGIHAADTASASLQGTDVRLGHWALVRKDNSFNATVRATDFALDLRCSPTQAVLLQGTQGLSRKGPDPEQVSHYYSQPQLRVEGSIVLQGKSHPITAGSTAWLDHEWSQTLLHPDAVGWDWIGINLLDGSALTAFQLRNKAGQALWDGGSFRTGTRLLSFNRGEVVFTPLRYWHSPLNQTRYPVEWFVKTPADSYTVKAVIDNQELDSRASTGAIYWEGLCEVWDSQSRLVGRGYLEMTGYASPLKL